VLISLWRPRGCTARRLCDPGGVHFSACSTGHASGCDGNRHGTAQLDLWSYELDIIQRFSQRNAFRQHDDHRTQQHRSCPYAQHLGSLHRCGWTTPPPASWCSNLRLDVLLWIFLEISDCIILYVQNAWGHRDTALKFWFLLSTLQHGTRSCVPNLGPYRDTADI